MKATINGKEITVIGKDVIQAVFTEKVQELISQGMRFSFTDRGSQGEISKCDLTSDEKTIYRVVCEDDRYQFGERFYESIRTVVVKVLKYENVNGSTLWNNEGEVVFEKTFFNLNDLTWSDSKVFVDDVELAMEIGKIQYERMNSRHSRNCKWNKLPETWNRKVLPIVRNRKGYKTVHLEDIKCVWKEFRCDKFYGFRIQFEGKKSEIWIHTK